MSEVKKSLWRTLVPSGFCSFPTTLHLAHSTELLWPSRCFSNSPSSLLDSLTLFGALLTWHISLETCHPHLPIRSLPHVTGFTVLQLTSFAQVFICLLSVTANKKFREYRNCLCSQPCLLGIGNYELNGCPWILHLCYHTASRRYITVGLTLFGCLVCLHPCRPDREHSATMKRFIAVLPRMGAISPMQQRSP